MILGVSGHGVEKMGILNDSDILRVRRLLVRAYKQLGATSIISGGSIGIDLAACFAAIDVGIPYDLYLPFKGYRLKWRYGRQQYATLDAKANKIKYISPPPYTNSKYFIRNHAIVDNCDILLVFWNGDLHSGTADTIKYAKKMGVEVKNLWGMWVKRGRIV